MSVDVGEEVYFDTSEASFSAREASFRVAYGSFDYEIWMKEPQSVKERRDKFFRGIDSVEFSTPVEELAFVRMDDRSGAVASSMPSCGIVVEESLVCCASREVQSEANSSPDELDHIEPGISDCDLSMEASTSSPSSQCCENKKKSSRWWKRLLKKQNQSRDLNSLVKVERNNKKCLEFSAMYVLQEIQAHKGLVWAMKFSPDGQFLATGGEDAAVRIWRVTSVDASSKCLSSQRGSGNEKKLVKHGSGRNKSRNAAVVFPNAMFHIDELPLHEFIGHTGDVLDLAWSTSNCILSSSEDNTVRLWQVGCDECLNVFRHKNYVTCIQFNPADNNYFISGSIDGKVRMWSVLDGRVVDWADVNDVVTALSYRPNGNGCVAGSISGTCRFYELSGNQFQFGGQTLSLGKKKASGNKITGIKFSQEEPSKVMITSENSKVRIFDGTDIIQKYKGLRNSGSQMSASFTSSGKHIVSVGQDSRVYVWNYGGYSPLSSKQTKKSVRSCEHFLNDGGMSLAVPWSGIDTEEKRSVRNLQRHEYMKDSECFSLGGWFSMDGLSRGSATWPEEKLPVCDVSGVEDGKRASLSDSWGLVIVTASWDGTIRTFHNYGLPIRVKD